MSAVEGCTHTRPHQHAKANTYSADCCRCRACTDAWTRYAKEYRHDRAHGRIRSASSGPVAAHVATLMDAGWTSTSIAAATGLCRETVVRVGQRERILASTAEAILRLRPGVTPIGAARRLQALAAIGWTLTDVSQRTGLDVSWLSHIRRRPGEYRAEPATCAQIDAAYQQLHLTPAPPGLRSKRALGQAERHGWAPPLAWDDIDHDKAPVPGWQRTRDQNNGDDVIELLNAGETPAAIAQRLGVRVTTVQQHRRRAAA